MINLLIDTNVLIHLLHPTGNAEAGLTRQLLDWDHARYIRLCVSSVSGHEQGRTLEGLVTELAALGLPPERVVSNEVVAESLLLQINGVLGHRKQGDSLDAQIVDTAWKLAQYGRDVLLVTGDRNILRHAEQLHALGVPPIVALRGAVKRLKVQFPLTLVRSVG